MKNKLFKSLKKASLSYLTTSLILIALLIGLIKFADAYGQNEIQPYGKNELRQGSRNIGINLGYNAKSIYDADNDGIGELDEVVDLSVKNTNFDWGVNSDRLCTRWEVYSIDDDKLTELCYGSDACCRFVGIAPSRGNWSEALYLTYGMHSSSENNIVGAQVIYVDYRLGIEKPYSEIYYSEWGSLPVVFKDSNNSINSINMESVFKNIENIRLKNSLIKKIDLKDKDGASLKELNSNKNISMIFNVSAAINNNFSHANKNDEIIVSINNFDSLNANWNGSEGINITTHNAELENSLKETGISPKTLVSVHGVNGFLNNDSYYGTVKLSVNGHFNSVIYCPDDKISSCRAVPMCLHEFNGIECYVGNGSLLVVYVPHFSSIVVGLDNSTASLTIKSPDDSNSLQNGEGVYLNLTTNETLNIEYSLDEQDTVSLGEGEMFSDLLKGILPYGILTNGLHDLKIYISDALSNSVVVNYSFSVSDSIAPLISTNITNNSAYSEAGNVLPISIGSDEHAKIKYKINSNDFSEFIDLGPSKSKTIGIIPVSGQNFMLINASDMHDNSDLGFFSFSFAPAQWSCFDGMQNGDETGLDCGGSCSVCIAFEVKTDKAAYNLTDIVYLTVIGRSNSTVNVTITRQNIVSYTHSFAPVFTGAPVLETRVVGNTSNAGNYTISAVLYYKNSAESKNASFEILSPLGNQLSVAINANATSINEGEAILFTSQVSGNTGAVSYKWDFQNDGTTDSTNNALEYKYGSNGTYNVNLTVSDLKWNQTAVQEINVRKMHNLTILVKDNNSGIPIENAEVEFDDEIKDTGSDGKVSYARPKDEYDLAVRKSGYTAFSNKTGIGHNTLVEVGLIEEDRQAPIIRIISPEDRKTVPNNFISLQYTAIDKSAMTCRLYVNVNSSSWKVESINSNVQSEADSSFALNDLKNNTYQWKIECIDRNGNSNTSDAYSVIVDTSFVENELSVDLNEQNKNTEDVLSQIDASIADIENLNLDEKEAADAMQLKKGLEKAKVAIQRANRDLSSLKFRRLNQSELEIETKNILEMLENVKDTTPIKIEVADKNEFVKYPSKEDVSKALQILLNSTNLEFSKKELNKLVQENHKLQSLITVTTKAKLLNVEYISGSKGKLTLINKVVDFSKDLGDLVFFEIIPKDFAKNLSELNLLFDYDVVDKDPVIKIDIQKTREFSYYINKRVGIEDTESLKSVLLSKNLKPEAKSLITGFAAFDSFSANIVKTSDIRLIAEFVIVVLLLAVYLYYQFGGYEKVELLFDRKLKEKLREVDGIIEKTAGYLEQGKYDEAKALYKDLNAVFKELPKNIKSRIYGKIIEIGNKIDFIYIERLLNEAFDCLKNSQKEKAFSLYSIISSLYKNVSREYKSKVHLKCAELHRKLNS